MDISNTELQKFEAVIEAVLFTIGDAVEIDKLALAIDQDVDTTKTIMTQMMEKYNKAKRGIKLIELEGSYQLCTRGEYFENLIRVVSQPRRYTLTDSLLETLSIIAYKQPITKLEIEKIRGVSSEHAVNRLVEYGLVGEVGRLDAPGRPILFATTQEFLRAFGVTSIDELPRVGADLIEEFKHQAEEEINEKIDVEV